MKIWISLFVLVFFWNPFLEGQSISSFRKEKLKGTVVKRLGIGDRMPDIIISDVTNYPGGKIKISDLKGKLTILDFWNTLCSSCVEAFPKMQKLQDKYSTQLQILLVNYQSKETVQQFLSKHKQITGLSVDLPIVCNDQQLNAYFKPPSFPHYVWVDEKGIIRYISFGDDVTAENIELVLNHIPLNIEEKKDSFSYYDSFKPLYVNGNGGNGRGIICYSMLSKSSQNTAVTSGYFYEGDSNSTMNAFSWNIKGLFQIAFNDYLNELNIPENRTILHVKDTSKYVFYINGKIQHSNLYNYQLFAPYRSAAELKKMMQQDLMRYFNLEAHIEKRWMKCWVMTAEDTALLLTKGGDYANGMSDQDYSIVIRNVPDTDLPFRFIYNFFSKSPYPFISDIHMKSHIDILVDNIDFNDANAVVLAIKKKYKINILLQDRLVDILVINEPECIQTNGLKDRTKNSS